jgi:hypothetical protein
VGHDDSYCHPIGQTFQTFKICVIRKTADWLFFFEELLKQASVDSGLVQGAIQFQDMA